MIQTEITPEIMEYVIMHLREEDREEACGLRTDGDHGAAVRASVALPGIAYAYCHDDGEPIVLGGYLHNDAPWLTNSWLVATHRIKDIGIQLVKCARRQHRVLAEHGIRRIQTLSMLRDGNAKEITTMKWLLHLGYVQEGIMRNLGAKGQSYAMMALVQP